LAGVVDKIRFKKYNTPVLIKIMLKARKRKVGPFACLKREGAAAESAFRIRRFEKPPWSRLLKL